MTLSRRTFASSAAALPLFLPASIKAQSPAPTDFTPAAERMSPLLNLAPQELSRDVLEILWTDYERQYAAFPDNSMENTRLYMPLGSRAIDDYSLDEYETALGFHFDRVRQTVHTGQDPNGARILTMDGDTSELPQAWEAAGWQLRETEVGQIWTIGEEGQLNFDWDDTTLDLAISGFFNIAVLDETTVASSDLAPVLEQVILTHSGSQDPIAPELDPLMPGIPEGAVSAWFLDGRVFEALETEVGEEGLDLIAQSDAAVGPMPGIQSAVVGYTAGFALIVDEPHPDERAYFLLQSAESGQAEQIATVVQWRMENTPSLETHEPYINLFDLLEYEVVNDDLMVVKANSLGDNQEELFVKMLERGDKTPFMYTA